MFDILRILVYDGVQFVDPNPTGNYVSYQKRDLSLDMILNIRDIMKDQISEVTSRI